MNRRSFLGAVVAAGTLRPDRLSGIRGSAQSTPSATAPNVPALLGGTPVRRTPFPSWPVADSHEEDALVGVIRSGRWNRGEHVSAFEKAYASLTGAKDFYAGGEAPRGRKT